MHYVVIVLREKFKRDVDIEIDENAYDYLISCRVRRFQILYKKTSITEYNGKIIDDKYLPLLNPAMMKFKPEAKKAIEEARIGHSQVRKGRIDAEKDSRGQMLWNHRGRDLCILRQCAKLRL